MANACGPCIGQWDRSEKKGEENGEWITSVDTQPSRPFLTHACSTAILTSFNRNFKARNDGNRLTMNFLASPDIVTAMAFSGKLSFDPTKDTLLDSEGKPFKFDPPQGDKLPEQGFTAGESSSSGYMLVAQITDLSTWILTKKRQHDVPSSSSSYA